jgi:serine/threonine protein phosphatase 1
VLIERILDEIGEAPAVLVFLGDYIDRGPQSRGVIDRLIDLRPVATTRFLCGNHDQSLLNFLADPKTGPAWCDFGGRETLRSYGVDAPVRRGDAEGWSSAASALAAVLPPEHLAFFRDAELAVTYGDYFFSHAGARPGVTLADQIAEDLMWIRDDFLNSRAGFDKIVVHGHTPSTEVQADKRRIGIDTGAYATGVLTALALQGTGRRLLQTASTDGMITVTAHDLPRQ